MLFPNRPSPWISGSHNLRANIKGEIDLGAIVVQKRVSRSKRVYSKSCISGSQGRWALCFCMEATQSQSLFINNGSGSKHKKTIFNTSTLRQHDQWEKWPKSGRFGHISVYEHTYYG